jgi:hypothetical protein
VSIFDFKDLFMRWHKLARSKISIEWEKLFQNMKSYKKLALNATLHVKTHFVEGKQAHSMHLTQHWSWEETRA